MGVFIARISRGRTIREFILGVLVVPSTFSLLWLGAFGGIGLFDVLRGDGALLDVAQTLIERVTFELLARLPFAGLTTTVTIAAAFLFIVTSVVSAAFVLGTFSSGGDPDPSLPKTKTSYWSRSTCALDRSGTCLGLASVTVTIPPTHATGQLDRPKSLPPDPRSAFTVLDPVVYGAEQALVRDVNAVLAERPKGSREILLFIHGYNTSTSDAVLRLTQFAHDGDFEWVPVLLSWASAAQPAKMRMT